MRIGTKVYKILCRLYRSVLTGQRVNAVSCRVSQRSHPMLPQMETLEPKLMLSGDLIPLDNTMPSETENIPAIINPLSITETPAVTEATAVSLFTDNMDIGNVSAAGSVSEVDGVYTVSGSGSDIWSSSDEFHFVYGEQFGDGQITARVASVSNTNGWAKAGVMFRDGVGAGDKFVMLIQRPDGKVTMQWRDATGSNAGWCGSLSSSGSNYLKLERNGDTFTGYYSADGSNWTEIATHTTVMSANAKVGLAVTSHNDGAVCSATFDNVEIVMDSQAVAAVNDSVSVEEGSSGNVLNVLENDYTNGGSLIIDSVIGSSNASIAIAADGLSILYSPVNGFSGADTFTYTVSDGNGGTDTATVSVNVISFRTPENPVNTIAGLDYEYFEGDWNNLPDFDELTPVETGTSSDFDISARQVNERFGFRFTGFIDIAESGTYTFYTSSDDGSALKIGDQLVVNNDGLHGMQERSGEITLAAGTHAITVTFFEKTGGEGLYVNYAGPSISKQSIPLSQLYHLNPNSNPVAVDDVADVNEGSTGNTIDAISNDTDVDSDNLVVSGLDTTGTLGVVVDNGDGTFSYSTNGQFDNLVIGQTATDLFSYTVSDGNGGVDTATVTVTVNGTALYVDATASGGNGKSWTNAFSTLQSALDAALSGDEIWIADGTYTPLTQLNGSDVRSATFSMKSGVSIYGGFEGSEAAKTDRVAGFETILSGDLGAIGDISDNAYTVVYSDGVSNVLLDGITISDGNANGDMATGYWAFSGGGMYTMGSSVSMSNVIISDNAAGGANGSGGGMANWMNSNITLTDTTFENNTATYTGGGLSNAMISSFTMTGGSLTGNISNGGGGGMYNWHITGAMLFDSVDFVDNISNGNVSEVDSGGGAMNDECTDITFLNVDFISNEANGDDGGGMMNYMTSAVITGGSFVGNSALNYGGGLLNYMYSDSIVTGVLFEGNTATHGGGVQNHDRCNPIFNNVTFKDNVAVNGGGLCNDKASTPTITGGTFIGNSASNQGGALYNRRDSLAALDSVEITSNSATRGGGIYNKLESNIQLTNVTFTSNTATTVGGGMVNDGSTATLFGVSFLNNSVIDGNGGGVAQSLSDSLLGDLPLFSGNTPDDIWTGDVTA